MWSGIRKYISIVKLKWLCDITKTKRPVFIVFECMGCSDGAVNILFETLFTDFMPF